MKCEPSFAVVVPFYNEEANVEFVCGELRALMKGDLSDGEVVAVDDGSSDRTAVILRQIAQEWLACRVFHFDDNKGQSAALLFGFSQTAAPVIVTMDGDGQNDVHDIPKLLARLKEADMVVGIRTDRKDSWVRHKISQIANGIRSRLLGDGVRDTGCALKAFRREVVGAFIPLRTLYSFMPSLAVVAGFRVVEEPVRHHPRRNGHSRYTIRSFLFLPIVDFVGLWWFQTRRCDVQPETPYPTNLGTLSLGEELYRRVVRKWLRTVAACLAVGAVAAALVFIPRTNSGMLERKVGLRRAERIALRQVDGGSLGTEEMVTSKGRPTWEIDVHLPKSTDLNEIYIDGIDGRVIATRIETAAEDAMEAAVEEHRYSPQHPPQ
ncbi:MAG: glycosyltransferase [Chthoniobacterales bacterium]